MLLRFSRPGSRFRSFLGPNILGCARFRKAKTAMLHHLARAAASLLAASMVLTAAVAANDPTETTVSGWRLIRSKNPQGGPDAVSMSHTADITRSDLELAGLMLRCADKGVDVVIVVVTPFPPRARPAVTVSASNKEWRFDTHVVPPGAELLLPAEAMALASGPWQSAHELAVKVSSPEQSFGGVIPIDGLADALATLIPNCPVH
jgi:hypothetical protein